MVEGDTVNNKATLGIIGAGRIGRLHAENIINFPNVNLKAISDIYIDHAKEWAKGLGIKHLYESYENIINDNEIDAILVCSPTNTHAEIMIEAAKKGKHIFCEKPISFSIEETEQVLDVVEENGVKLQVGFNRRFDRNFSKIHQSVKNGIVGEPHIVKITSRDPEPPPIDYIKGSGGLFFDMAIHDFDMARYIAQSEVTEVYAVGKNLIDRKIGTEGNDIDTAITTLTFENGAICVIDNSRQAVYGYDQRVEVLGSKGQLTCDNDRPTSVEISTEDGTKLDPLKHFFLERYKDAYIVELQSFVNAIINDEKLQCDGNDGLQAELIARAAKRSFEKKRSVKLTEVMSN